MNLTQRTSRGLLWNQLAKLVEFGLAFALSVMLARGLGVEDYGLYSVTLAVVFVALFLASLGFEETLNTQVAKLSSEGEEGKESYLLRRMLALRGLLLAGGALLLWLAADSAARLLGYPEIGAYLRMALLYLLFSGLGNLFAFHLLGRMEAARVGAVRIAVALAALILAYLSLRSGLGVGGQIWAITAASAVGLALYLIAAGRSLFGSAQPYDLGPAFSFGRAAWATGALNFLIGKQSDILLLGAFLHNTAIVAFYNVAYGLQSMISSLLFSGAEGVSLAAFSEAEARKNPATLAGAWALHLKLDQVLLIPGMLFAAWYAAPLVTLVYSAAYSPSILLLQMFLVLALVGRAAGGGTNVAVLYAMDRPRPVLWARGACAALNLGANLVLIPRFGALGAVIGTGVSGAILALIELVILLRVLPARYPAVFLVKTLGIAAAALAVTTLVPVRSGPDLALAAALYALTFAAGFLALRPLSVSDKDTLAQTHPWMRVAVRYL